MKYWIVAGPPPGILAGGVALITAPCSGWGLPGPGVMPEPLILRVPAPGAIERPEPRTGA